MKFILSFKFLALVISSGFITPNLLHAQNNLDSARHFLKIKEYEKAKSFADAELNKNLPPPLKAEALLIKGESMIRTGKVFQSLETLQSSSSIIDTIAGHDSIRIMINYYLGYVYTNMYDKRSIPILEQCYKDISKVSQLDSTVIFSIISGLGRAHLFQGEYNQAQPYNIMAEEIALHLKDSIRISSVYNNMAIVSNLLFDYDDAIIRYDLSKNYISKSDPKYDYKLNKYLLNVSGMYVSLGRLQEAESYIRQGIDNGAGKAYSMMTKLYSNLSDVYEQQGLYEKGLEYIRIAHQLGIESLGPKHPVTNNQRLKLSQLAFRNEKHQEALTGYEQAIENFSNSFGENHPFVGAIQVSMAKVQIELGNLNPAEELLESAAKKLAQSSDPQLYTDYGYTKINLAIANKDWTLALSEIDTAYSNLNYLERGNFNNTLLPVRLLDFLSQEAEIHALMGGRTGKLKSLELSKEFTQLADHFIINDSDSKNKYLLFQEHYDVYEQAITICSELSSEEPKYIEDAFFFMEKSKSNLLGSALNDFDIENELSTRNPYHLQKQALTKKITYFDNRVYEFYQRGDPDRLKAIPALNDSIFNFKSELYTLNRKIKDEFPNYFQSKYQTKITSLIKLQETLDPNTAILEYFCGDESAFVLLITSDNQTLIPIETNSITSDVKGLNAQLNSASNYSQNSEDWHQITQRLSQQILIPALKKLDNSIHALIIIPDGPVASIPFAVLPTEDAEYLIEEFNISYNNSSSIWYTDIKNTNNIAGHLLAFAPNYDIEMDISQDEHLALLVRDGNYNLPGASDEVSILSDQLGGKVFEGDDASKSQFMSQNMANNVLHLAMHAVVNTHHPQFNHLVFSPQEKADYNLYASEILNMQIDAQMAVLSACNTGTGAYQRGEGPQSLGNAFRFAGVKATAMSLWKVPDHSTKIIMTSFYSNLQKSERKDRALQLAMIDYLDSANEEEMKHPKYWSSFLIYGNMDPIHFEKDKSVIIWIAALALLLLISIFMFRNSRNKTDNILYN